MKKKLKPITPKITDSEETAPADISFCQMFADVVPINSSQRVLLSSRPRQLRISTQHASEPDTRFVSTENLDEMDESPTFIRTGQNHQVIRKLKRGFWPIHDELDLHGYTREEAQHQLSAFLHHVIGNGSCVRIIHGRALGARHGPVLKRVTRAWLRQQNEVLAYCEAPPGQGGDGALLVLLKNRKKESTP